MGRKSGRDERRQSKARPSPAALVTELDPVEILIARARRLRRKGESRKTLVLLRDATLLDEHRARTWALLGALCAELGHRDEAARAFKQARWLRLRAGEEERARVLAGLLERLLDEAA
jgi:Flp pilus assembly protein TadD